jgi:N utilization substance protein B
MKKSRRKSREYALKGLYQWKVTGDSADVIERQLQEDEEFGKADDVHFAGLLRGAIAQSQDLDQRLTPYLDRPAAELSPIEHAILLLAAFELVNHPEIPYRVVINEAVELAKSYGGTDGHKYVNGVVDKLAAAVRAVEIKG